MTNGLFGAALGISTCITTLTVFFYTNEFAYTCLYIIAFVFAKCPIQCTVCKPVCHNLLLLCKYSIWFKAHTVQPARNLHLNTHHRDLPQRVRWKWPPRSVFIADISGGHRRSIAHGSEHRATRCTITADPDGRTRWSMMVNCLFYTIYMCIM